MRALSGTLKPWPRMSCCSWARLSRKYGGRWRPPIVPATLMSPTDDTLRLPGTKNTYDSFLLSRVSRLSGSSRTGWRSAMMSPRAGRAGGGDREGPVRLGQRGGGQTPGGAVSRLRRAREPELARDGDPRGERVCQQVVGHRHVDRDEPARLAVLVVERGVRIEQR